MSGPGSTAPRQFAFTTRAHAAVDDATGEPVGLDDVDTRVRWLLDLIAAAGGELVSRLWQPVTFDVLTAGRDCAGRRLPAQGHVAAARLGWNPVYADKVYVPSRVTRVVTAQVMASLRTLAYRDAAIAALSERFDPATGRITPPTAAADGVPMGFARGVRRQLVAHARRTDGAQSARLRITDIQRPPQVTAMARLSAADRQLAQITATERELVLTVKLPTCPAPSGRAQWRWVRLTAAVPGHLLGRAITDWHLPTLVLDARGLLWRCAATELVPAGDLGAATVAVGVDWSPSTLGAAAITTENSDGLSSDYRGFTYDDRGLGIKLARLQAEGQMLHRKAARLTRLAATAPPEVRAQLEAKIAVLNDHRTAVGVKRGKINRELAFHFARQVTDYAAAAGAQVIAVEDLTTLETRGHGRVNNNRAAQSARRKATAALAHTAAGGGIAVVSVPARGSSAQCPGCDEPLARPGGYHTAWCSRCLVGGNRDHVAGVNLAKRALLGKGKVTRRRGRLPTIRVAEHAPVRKFRDKNGPTPSRPRHRRVRRSLPTATPRMGVTPKQHVPASQASVWDTVKPAPPNGDAGSRDTRRSPTIVTPLADSMRSTQTLWIDERNGPMTGVDRDTENVTLTALLARIAQGERDAFSDFYERTSARVYGMVLRVLRDPGYSEETTQEVYLQVWNNADKFDPKQGSPLSWLITLAHRRAVDRVRSEQSGTEREAAYGASSWYGPFDAVSEEVTRRGDTSDVVDCLGTLTEVQQRTVVLAYYGGLTYREVSERLSVALPTVKSRIRDGLIRLKQCLGVQFDG